MGSILSRRLCKAWAVLMVLTSVSSYVRPPSRAFCTGRRALRCSAHKPEAAASPLWEVGDGILLESQAG